MGRGSRLLVWLLIAVLATGVAIALSYETIAIRNAEYTVEVVGHNPSPVCRAEYGYISDRDTAEKVLRGLAERPDWGWTDDEARLLSDRSFEMWGIATSRQTIFGTTYTHRPWAVVVVELADGTRRARVLDLPDPRTKPTTLVFRLDDEPRP
jgi:hypothetical protein